MACFGIGVIEHLLIWIVVVVAVVLIIRVLLGFAASAAPEWAPWINGAIQIVRIILGAAIIIAVIVVIFALLACIVPIRW